MSQYDPSEDILRDASRHYASGAIDKAKTLLRKSPVPRSLAARAAFVQLQRKLGAPLPAEEARLDSDVTRTPETPEHAFDRAKALVLLDHPDALAAAQLAHTLSPTEDGPVLLELKIRLEASQPDEALEPMLAS